MCIYYNSFPADGSKVSGFSEISVSWQITDMEVGWLEEGEEEVPSPNFAKAQQYGLAWAALPFTGGTLRFREVGSPAWDQSWLEGKSALIPRTV